ncbi:MAG: BLUF domain-containing protein, partial [Burkholderiaceae bacterium]|nr:BLUF domain-containing protein [Burkholderiaceae bacterium]
MLSRLIYASEVTDPLNPSDIQALLEHARRCNRLRDITGMLAFDSRYFLQAVEGGRQSLSDLYGRLVTDGRHRRLKMLGLEAVPERLFTSWSMGFASAGANCRSLYLRHGTTGQFEPHVLSSPAALALLIDLAKGAAPETQGSA